ncbi:Uncharacterised protein [Klebsiella pneumoniae]|uniref:hypothetical protein n=1 Tax=Klebsiella pneumoniae TaxID=573 RepID=UPI000E2C7C78|nr:hypothetical protein [Klebsiella pneumoniae]VVK73898.1 Uncharacterised protein [Klebsiella pneumoniae]
MTDITELAQSLKAAAIDAKELAIIARYSKGRAAAEKFYALANPNNVIALVEALEKAQQQIIALQQLHEVDPRTHEIIDMKERIAELESRTVTVKLPDIMPPEAAPAHYWGSGESMAYADGYNKSAADLKTSFALSCSSAGVNVEFE